MAWPALLPGRADRLGAWLAELVASGRRLVVTIYDLSFVTHPESHLPANVEHCLRGTRLAIDRADALIAISESTRRELIDEMGAPPERIAVLSGPNLAREIAARQPAAGSGGSSCSVTPSACPRGRTSNGSGRRSRRRAGGPPSSRPT